MTLIINNLGCLRRELVKSKVTNSKKRMTEPAVSEFKVHKLLKADDSKAVLKTFRRIDRNFRNFS